MAVRRKVRGAAPWAWAAALFVLYATLSVQRHRLLRTTGYDLGIFEQAVKAYSQLRLPYVPLKGEGVNLLGDHFHPVLALLAPLYRLFPAAETLLLAQAALLALAVVPLARWAGRALGRAALHAIAIGYGLSWGIASTVAFDFHEVAFAVPLLAFSLEALGRGRYEKAVLLAVPLLLVKEDLGLTLAALGGYLVWRGRRAIGFAALLGGVLGTLVITKVLLPALNSSATYAYGEYVSDGPRGSVLMTLLAAPLDALRPEVKAVTLVLVFAPTALLALRSPIALLALPTLGWRLLSQHDYHWETAFHYSAVLMPIVFAAAIDALTPYGRFGPFSPSGAKDNPLAARHLRASLATMVAVALVLLPSFSFGLVLRKDTWRTPDHVRAARTLLDRIPDGATVAASNRLVPQLVSRTTVVLFPGYPVPGELYDTDGTPPPPTSEWILHDSRPHPAWPLPDGHWPYPPHRQQEELARAQKTYGYRIVAEADGLTLLHREGAVVRGGAETSIR
ncbi:hypothetical protein GCM10010329_02830 [Streptomyces spiroverticillatus]|uniref:DUF2079 domain-containing protein n=1 Tax=Streptomyces finlayi TaxID=67296 RepID=A0A918WSE9_9ACTN|nr:hypothetical protein GCM10010329_02830 [Streptomyces spiroverticillatus]GHC77966.1 hypothetical protein GCM10010334_02810 [Streptomyces finlayi]